MIFQYFSFYKRDKRISSHRNSQNILNNAWLNYGSCFQSIAMFKIDRLEKKIDGKELMLVKYGYLNSISQRYAEQNPVLMLHSEIPKYDLYCWLFIKCAS